MSSNFSRGSCDCPGCGCTLRNQWALAAHMKECSSCLPRLCAEHFIRRQAQRRVQKKKRPHEGNRATDSDQPRQPEQPPLRAASVPVLLPLRWPQLDPVAVFGNERTYVYFETTLHNGHFSHDRAAAAIAGQLATTAALPEPLLMEPRNGLRDAYARLDALAEDLGLQFTEHKVHVTLGRGADAIDCTVSLHLRSLLACCRLLFGYCTPEHCTPRRQHHDGQRAYSTPYSAAWAGHVLDKIRTFDPDGLLFAIDVGWDKTSLSKVQSAYPLYVKANAWPLDEQNKHRGLMCWGYYGSLPEAIQLQVSSTKATQLRRKIASSRSGLHSVSLMMR